MSQHYFVIKPFKALSASNPSVTVSVTPFVRDGRTIPSQKIIYIKSVAKEEELIGSMRPLSVAGVDRDGILIDVPALEKEGYIKPYIQLKAGQTLRTKIALRGVNNSYNQPTGLNVPAGTLLEADWTEGTNRGDYFFKLDGLRIGIRDFQVLHPYGLPLYFADQAEVVVEDETV